MRPKPSQEFLDTYGDKAVDLWEWSCFVEEKVQEERQRCRELLCWFCNEEKAAFFGVDPLPESAPDGHWHHGSVYPPFAIGKVCRAGLLYKSTSVDRDEPKAE